MTARVSGPGLSLEFESPPATRDTVTVTSRPPRLRARAQARNVTHTEVVPSQAGNPWPQDLVTVTVVTARTRDAGYPGPAAGGRRRDLKPATA